MAEIGKPFEQGDFAQAIRLLDRHFDGLSYSLRSLFRDEQRRVLDLILASTLAEAEDELREMYVQNAPLMRFLTSLGTPLPNAFRSAAELVLNLDLKRALAGPADPEEVQLLLDEASGLGVDLDEDGLSYALEHTLEELVGRLGDTPMDDVLLSRVEAVADLARKPPFRVNLWRAQNRCHEMLAGAYLLMKDEAEAGEETAAEWVERFRVLAGKLGFRVD